MDEQRFDRFARSLAWGQSRRGVLAGLSGTIGAGFLSALGWRGTVAQEGCAEGLTDCGGACVDLGSSPFNCGACGQACVGGVCFGGACGACGAGLTACSDGPNGFCADLLNDARNCGACGRVCATGGCVEGTCLAEGGPAGCAEGETTCGGVCTVLASDPNNCGACGIVCFEGATCVEGGCQGVCREGLTDCGGYCADLANAADNCGACGVVCDAGTVCLGGACAVPDADPVEPTAETSPSPTAEATTVAETPAAEPTAEATTVGETPAVEPTATAPSPTPSPEIVDGTEPESTPTIAPTEAGEEDETPTAEPEATATATATPRVRSIERADSTATGTEAARQAGGVRRVCPATSEEENEALARGWYETLGDGDFTAFGELLADDVVLHASNLADAEGVAAVAESLGSLVAGFSGIRFRVDQAIPREDLVVLRWTTTGTHDGDFRGLPATGREATWTGINIFRVECGRIAEVWSEVDGLGLLRQLGVLPAATPTP